MPGPAVTIVDEGGIPVIPVAARAPVVTVYVPPEDDPPNPPRGTPITIVEANGTPMVVEGYTP